ncbi:MAG: methyltransferase [Acidilobaceae archaeon]
MSLELHPCVYEPAEDTLLAIEAVRKLKEMDKSYERVAEVGTGSGAIALALYRTLRPAVLLATDISPYAVSVARRNLPPEVHVARCHGLCSPGPWDLVVMNPPYLPVGREEDRCEGWLSAAWAGEGVMEELVREALSSSKELLLVYSSLSPFKPSGLKGIRLGSERYFFEELVVELLWRG